MRGGRSYHSWAVIEVVEFHLDGLLVQHPKEPIQLVHQRRSFRVDFSILKLEADTCDTQRDRQLVSLIEFWGFVQKRSVLKFAILANFGFHLSSAETFKLKYHFPPNPHHPG